MAHSHTAHSVFDFFSRIHDEALHLGYQGEFEIIAFVVLLALAAGAYALALILLIYSLRSLW